MVINSISHPWIPQSNYEQERDQSRGNIFYYNAQLLWESLRIPQGELENIAGERGMPAMTCSICWLHKLTSQAEDNGCTIKAAQVQGCEYILKS